MKYIFIHTVYFWLHANTDNETRSSFEEGLVKLGTAPSIQAFYWGKSAGSSREVVDGSFDYSITVLFASKEDHDEYQKHLVHDEFREEYSTLWSKVKVYDALVN